MTCSPEEDRILRRLGIPGALVSQNAYVNEHIFTTTGTLKSFDAVYTAQMQPFKRLHLAADVRSLFVVTYGDVLTADGEYDLHRFSPAVAHAEFNRRWIGFSQINDVYNRSRVGLALSACEGAMLAAVEYMLAGLPMVSTDCKGGRELFFDDRFVSVVEPTPEAVVAGVSELIHREVDPALVRQATLARVIEHRRKLCAYVRGIIRRTGTARVPGDDTLYERIFGSPEGTRACYVHSRDFAAMGWRPGTG
jgi:glycosyltransferase involved in cell wall biosynthesis